MGRLDETFSDGKKRDQSTTGITVPGYRFLLLRSVIRPEMPSTTTVTCSKLIFGYVFSLAARYAR